MSLTKVSIIYYSQTGTIDTMAHRLAATADRPTIGGIIVSPGSTDGSKFIDGNPYGVSHVTGPGNDLPVDDITNTALDHLVTRVIAVTERLKA